VKAKPKYPRDLILGAIKAVVSEKSHKIGRPKLTNVSVADIEMLKISVQQPKGVYICRINDMTFTVDLRNAKKPGVKTYERVLSSGKGHRIPRSPSYISS